MKDLNKCCDESKCVDCAFYVLDNLCTFAWNKPSIKLSVIVERLRKELDVLDSRLNKLDKEVEE